MPPGHYRVPARGSQLQCWSTEIESQSPMSFLGLCLPTTGQPQNTLFNARLSQGAMVDRLEAVFHPEIREQLCRGNNAPVCDLESRFPWHQVNFRSPNRADQDESLLRAREAYTTAETEKSRLSHDATGLLRNLPAKSLLPRLVTLRAASRPAPALAIMTDQHHAVFCRYAETICAMRSSRRGLAGRIPLC